jgi:hypothetical protein
VHFLLVATSVGGTVATTTAATTTKENKEKEGQKRPNSNFNATSEQPLKT